jgi:D-alanyl-D-alanine carboxypeptidase/D-alanyl-D-alanine-endopeptidase (penicillin-binding protein 4)
VLAEQAHSIAAALDVPGARSTALAVDPALDVLLERSSTRALPPASTVKLLTVGAALVTLGPQRRFTTTVTTTAAVDGSGAVAGDLVLTGAGDPSLRRRDLRDLADQVALAGITEVTGRLVLDDTLLDRQRGALGWRGYYVGEEVGPLSAITVDDNLWRRDRAFRRDPVPATAALWRGLLGKAGVHIQGAAVTAKPDQALLPVAHHDSAELRDIATHVLQDSDNTQAELLLKQLGLAGTGSGSTAAGLAVLRSLAQDWGLVLNGRITDGSGLSVLDRLDAASMVGWLQALDAHGWGAELRRALPVSCRSGTLKRRLCGRWLAGRATAKTGTLDYTAAMAGWTITRSGRAVVFAIVVDGPPASRGRRALDASLAKLMRSTF